MTRCKRCRQKVVFSCGWINTVGSNCGNRNYLRTPASNLSIYPQLILLEKLSEFKDFLLKQTLKFQQQIKAGKVNSAAKLS